MWLTFQQQACQEPLQRCQISIEGICHFQAEILPNFATFFSSELDPPFNFDHFLTHFLPFETNLSAQIFFRNPKSSRNSSILFISFPQTQKFQASQNLLWSAPYFICLIILTLSSWPYSNISSENVFFIL